MKKQLKNNPLALFVGIAFFFWGAVPTLTYASEKTEHILDQELNTCLKEFPGTTSERNCVYNVIPKWEERLQTYYVLLGGNKAVKLYQAQQAWVNYRKKQELYLQKKYCHEGTLYRLLEAYARLELVRSRALDLEADHAFNLAHR